MQVGFNTTIRRCFSVYNDLHKLESVQNNLNKLKEVQLFNEKKQYKKQKESLYQKSYSNSFLNKTCECHYKY